MRGLYWSGILALFPSSIDAHAFFLALFLMFIGEIVGGRVIPKLRRRNARIIGRDKGSVILTFGSSFTSLLIVFAFAWYGIAMLPGWFFYPGMVLIVLGILIRQWSMFTLGRYFTETVCVQEGQKVVCEGPYRLVRHPSYSGLLLVFIGVGLALQSWGAIITIILVFTVVFANRIIIEEEALISFLGDEYTNYMKKRKRLIPFLI